MKLSTLYGKAYATARRNDRRGLFDDGAWRSERQHAALRRAVEGIDSARRMYAMPVGSPRMVLHVVCFASGLACMAVSVFAAAPTPDPADLLFGWSEAQGRLAPDARMVVEGISEGSIVGLEPSLERRIRIIAAR